MKSKLFILTTILGLQTVWVLGTAFVQEHALSSGAIVNLETQPVDPRDLLRGDFVILSYKISDVPLSLFSPPRTNTLVPGTTVYVLLEPRGQFHQLVRAGLEPFRPEKGQVQLRGQTVARWGGREGVRVEYGLERYHVPEDTGNPRGKLTVQAAVPASGRPSIKQLLVDGQPYSEAAK
jgi:uncharacterized membrane-anchored protein